ncbi:phage protein Gp27 family protein [Caloranaerobacter sp. DY30410]|uniref:phage protein Gp27 family protein n=1 Tax=Caloranaerobacter sp. DY30410 TaxID=3238305 RepID=UPI003D0165B6
MGKKRRKTRVWSKIDELPEEIKQKVDEMLADTSYTYLEISNFLKSKGFDISKSAVGRYALRTNNATQRLIEAQQQAKALASVIKNNPEIDYTEATMQMLMSALTEKIAMAQEEFDAMPIDKAGRLIIALSRTKVYKEKVKQDMKAKIDLAFEKLEEDILKAIKGDPQLAKELKELLEKAKTRMMADD